MRRPLLILSAVVVALSVAAIPVASATPPEPVTIELDETFTSTGVEGSFTAAGGVLGSTSGTMASVSFKPGGFSATSRDHAVVYTASDLYTTGAGTFLVKFEGSCAFAGYDPQTNVLTFACGGNWQVNGGTGSYARLKGTGTFTEEQRLDAVTFLGSGDVILVGAMHDD